MTAMFLASALAGCSDLRGDYDLPAGDANYDALKAAIQACQSRGGRIALKSGYDNRELSSYRCHRGGKAPPSRAGSDKADG